MIVNLNPNNNFAVRKGKVYRKVLCYRFFNRERYTEVEVKNEAKRLTILRVKGYNRLGLKVN